MISKAFVAALIAPCLIVGASVPASASSDDCRHLPRAEWRPMEDAIAAVRAKGYDIREVERDDGCYEVKATGKSGEKVELYLDPGTLEIVRTKNRW
jgi:hypothetical protein